MNFNIALIGGDGIGPEVTAWAVKSVEKAGLAGGHTFKWTELQAGGCAIDQTGEPLPQDVLKKAKACDALLLGAVGGPKWENLPGNLRPERALLGLRAGLGVFANLRPAYLLLELKDACPLKDEVLKAGNSEGKASFDLLIVRELTGGIYFGERGRGINVSGSEDFAYDTEKYSRSEIERVLRVAYDAAAKRRGKLCLVDKANVLESSRFWREITQEMAKEYPNIETSYLYVDNAAMQLIRAPGQFDVIVTSNLFGDILSDEASVISGSIGMLASASIGQKEPGCKYPPGMYEPIHGSAPDIAGKNLANPLAAILSGAMMLRYSFGLETEALKIEQAVSSVLKAGYRTKDIAGRGGSSVKEKITGTKEIGEAVLAAL
ncbi:MAG: 3-isopropylmalate dehydrogenase [Spirochaetaceae bacterium]|jgi:3-isopropylmalate dehydrogenase|nr:3-isopropylmalate dehydrogenase [Spirochaetaceae bacterium]